jgi:hypothetical protein
MCITAILFSMVGIAYSASTPQFSTLQQPRFSFNAENFTAVNAADGAQLSFITTRLIVSPGTYVKTSSGILSTYNLSLISFSIQGVPIPASNSSIVEATGAFGIAVNGQINNSIEFVNSSGAPKPVILRTGGQSKTLSSWLWSGGNFVNLTYLGGGYVKPDTWSQYNSTIIQTRISSSGMHVLVSMNKQILNSTTVPPTTTTKAAVPSTTLPQTTTPYTTIENTNSYVYISIIAIETIIIIALVLSRARRKPAVGIAS